MGSVSQFLYQKWVLCVGIFWFSVSTSFLPLFRCVRTYLFRLKKNDSSSKDNSNHWEISSEGNNQKGSNHIKPEPDLQDVINFTDGFSQKEEPEFCFKFKFPTYEEFNRSRRETGDSISFDAGPYTSTSKYEFISEKGFSGFIEEPEVFNAKELNTSTDSGPFGDKDSVSNGPLSVTDFIQINSEAKSIHEEGPEDSTSSLSMDDVPEKIEAMTFSEKKGQSVDAENSLLDDQDVSDVFQFQSEKDFSLNSDSESISSSPLHSVRILMNRLIVSYGDGFLSDGDFGEEFDIDTSMDMDGEKEELHDGMSDLDENHSYDSSNQLEEDDFDQEDRYSMEEPRKLEEPHLQSVGKLNSDFHEDNDKKPEDTSDNSEKGNAKVTTGWDSEDSNDLETLWEHQELIEQLKMELKKARAATGLPTILEESEFPKITEDLKPWKIDDKFQQEDRMDELHKFYKSYRERMRKFDIFNYQKMYAIGFLQLKDPLQSISSPKSSVPSIASILSQNFCPCKRKKIGTDPMMNFIKELQSDLEVVYVGQMCLSWEILHWQYGRALELWESDPRGVHQYNEVAGEFQQFQVLLQRFTEDEPFQGPRVQNYVKSRCVLRNLLQVPIITEDSTKDRKKAIRRRESSEYAITSDMLVEIMEESIRIFWRFVRADKSCSNVIVKCRRGPHVELLDPADSDLLMAVQANLRKKEKKLKDLLRSGNCILRRFRKCQEDDSDQVLYFFSQVDMKLVSRVLNMSRITTEQLLWCSNKLSNISFVNRKIQVEPSFLLFPC